MLHFIHFYVEDYWALYIWEHKTEAIKCIFPSTCVDLFLSTCNISTLVLFYAHQSSFYSNSQIQKALGCKRNPLAYDITAACSGFVLGLVSAACHIRGNSFSFLLVETQFFFLFMSKSLKTLPMHTGGDFKNVLVIGADALSRYVDWTDRGTCILFGDAAGAVLVQVIISLLGLSMHKDISSVSLYYPKLIEYIWC